jgi:hypothetical protein
MCDRKAALGKEEGVSPSPQSHYNPRLYKRTLSVVRLHDGV